MGPGGRPELRAEEKALIEEQLKSPELRPLVCLIEARGRRLMRSARDGDEMRTSTNMRALLSAIASGREEIDRLGRRHGWTAGVKEEMSDRLQAMVHEPMQRGGDLVMSSIPYTWREQAVRRVSQAEGVNSQITRTITTDDWSLQHCHDYLVELRQKHLDAKLQVKDRPMQAFRGMQGGTPGPSPGRQEGYDDPQFSGRLDDLREFWRCWGEYERLYYPKEQEDVLMELLHSQALGPELRKVVSRARSLGKTWKYLEDHLREQRKKIDHLLSDTLRAGEPVGPEELYRYYKKVCQFLDTKEGEGTVSCHVTMDQLDMLLCTLPAEETFKWGRRSERRPLEDLPDLFYDFCWERAEELRAQIRATEERGEEPRVTALPSSYPRWLGPCVLGEICGGHHMPEVCQMFEAMTPEGRLSVIQKKQLGQFCFRHPDTQPCPSHSLPACPIRGCMRMHHRMLHRALMREEARPIVLGMAQNSGGSATRQRVRGSHSARHRMSLPATDRRERGAPGDLRLRGGGDHHRGRDEAAFLGQRGVPICQGTHAMDGHTGGPDRVAHRPGQLAVAASTSGGLQGAKRDYETDEVLVWASVYGDGRLGNSTLPHG
jgi:hypothetical protein